MLPLLLVVFATLSLSFLCSILESVFLSVTHSYVELLEDDRPELGGALRSMRQDVDEPIAAILTLNTIANTIGAALGGAIALRVFGNAWVAAFSAVLTLMVLLFAEITPKTFGARHWERLAPFVTRVLRWLIIAMKPILLPLRWYTRLITHGEKKKPRVDRAELEVTAEIGKREGTIDHDEWQVVRRVMKLHEVRVSSVMTPRTEMHGISSDATVEEAKETMLAGGHLRLPVYRESLDEITGVLVVRDLLRAEKEGVTDIGEVMREPLIVPDSTSAERLLEQMREMRAWMAIVIDEHGGTAGLVTVEDLVEEIIGEIHDEDEREPDPLEERRDGEVRIQGVVPLKEFNARFDTKLPEDDYDTVGGFVLGELGRPPRRNDEVVIPGGRLRVVEVDGRRAARLLFESAPPSGDEDAGSPD